MAFLRARVRGEGGFTILESTVALVIIFGVLLTLLRTLDSGIRVLVETKRQAVASALANELLERARSLEWENTGLTASTNSDNCPDPDPATKDGVACSTWAGDFGVATIVVGSENQYTFEGDVVVFVNEDQTFDPFLQFHEQVERDGTIFDRFLFVTSVRSDPADSTTERFRKLTAIVQWTPPSGFRKEIRHLTFVAPFEEPSQPFLQGSITFDGGFATISGMVQGTSDFVNPLAARPTLTAASVEFPDGQVSAHTDYVSGASVLGQGMVGEVRWVDGFTDQKVANLSGGTVTQYEKRADDEFGSAPPLDDPSDGLKSFDSWSMGQGSPPPPHDFQAVEVTDDESAFSQASVEGEGWTQYNPLGADPKDDGLPYAKLRQLWSAEAAAAGFTEYENAAPLLEATYYLKGSSVPESPLSASAPTASTLPNYDSACDAAAGRFLQKTGAGLSEVGLCKHHLWLAAAGQVDLSLRTVSVKFWSAMKDFSLDKRGVVNAYLLDCEDDGDDCIKIAEGQRELADWQGGSTTWVARDISFGQIASYVVPSGRSLAVKLVVDTTSDDDMWFAYDTTSYPSQVRLAVGTTYAEPAYDFFLVSVGQGSGPFLKYDGRVDRYETSVSARRVDVDFGWDGELVFFGRDTAYDAVLGNARKFLGWIKVEMPVVGGVLYAGEAAAPAAWDANVNNLRISYWSPTAGADGKGAYVLLYDKNYYSVTSLETVHLDASPGTGVSADGPFTFSLNDSSHPKLRYEVRANLTVNPPIISTTFDSQGDRAQVVMQAPSIVTGTFEYLVEDTAAVQALYDVDVVFGLGGVDATARYINPEAV